MIKNHTDLEQSKKLAEILPLDSADYCWGIDYESKYMNFNRFPYISPYNTYENNEDFIPCWSLAALLSVLPRIDIEKEICSNDTYDYRVKAYIGDGHIGDWYDNLVDACCEMILKLHELNLL